MGWSLGGILAGAARGFGGGVADWAGREIVEEKRINEEVRQEERQIAREGRANAEADRRQDRVQELLDKRELAAKEAMAFEYGAAKESATEAGLKEGTPTYYEHMATFLDTSGNAAGGKEFRAHASKEELARERLAHAAAIRSSRGGGRSGDSEETKIEKAEQAWIKNIGSYSSVMTDKETGKPVRHSDNSQVAVLDRVLGIAKSDPELKADARTMVREAAAGGRELFAKDPSKYADLGHATEVWMGMQQTPKTPPPKTDTAQTAAPKVRVQTTGTNTPTKTTNSDLVKRIPQ